MPSDDAPTGDEQWTPWIVAPQSGFEVRGDSGAVGLIQIDRTRFVVSDRFRFGGADVERELIDGLVSNGKDPAVAKAAVRDALTFVPTEDNPTDLASIPPFVRWFENSYGKHTLAAIIHDQLIVAEPNGGLLESDVASDSLFRDMMRSADVRWLRRWTMWSAVALRTRWVAGGVRQASVMIWLVLAVVGISTTVVGCVQLATGQVGRGLALIASAGALGVGSAALWGRQAGAGLIGMVAGFFIVPASVLTFLARLAFQAIDKVLNRFGRT